MKFKGVLATTNVDLDGEQFTPEALQQLADTAVGKPLKWNFEYDLPGKITDAFVEDGRLVVMGEIPLDFYLVPGFIDDRGGELKMFAVGLTTTPADPALPPLRLDLDWTALLTARQNEAKEAAEKIMRLVTFRKDEAE